MYITNTTMSTASQTFGAIGAVAAPEMAVASSLAPHVGSFMMMPLIMIAILFIIIGLIGFVSGSTKVGMFAIVGLLIGGFGFWQIHTNEKNISRRR